VVPLLALLAACTFALGSVLQRKGTLATSDAADDGPWLIQILHKPVWLTTEPPVHLDSCDFCRLCWKRIIETDVAYLSEAEWICRPCYERYLEGDLLGLRTAP
jgi:hypothetical protein